MSDNILEADDMFDQAADVAEAAVDDAVLTPEVSQEESFGSAADDAPADQRKSWLKSFSVFDGLLLFSLICVSLATLFLFLELSKFGSLLEGFPWRTNEFLNQ